MTRLAASSLLPILFACSSGSDTVLQESAARAFADKPLDLLVAQQTGDGQTAGDWLEATALTAPLLVLPDRVAAVLHRDRSVRIRTGVCACDAAGCQFEGCAEENGSDPIDGSIQRTGDSFAIEVTIARDPSSLTDVIDGLLTITSTIGDATSGQIDGYIEGLRGANASWRVDWQQVTVVGGCAAAGTLTVHVANSVGAPGGYEGTHELDLIGGCGED